MNWFNKTLHSAFAGAAIDLPAAITAGTLEIVFISGDIPDLTDTGDEFWDDLTGVTIHSTVLLNAASGANWTARLLDATDGQIITDPGAGTATWAIVRINTGTPATTRLLLAEDIVDYIFDGTDDVLNFNASGIAKIGA